MQICPIIEIFPSTIDLFTDGQGRVILDIDASTTIPLTQSLETDDKILQVEQPKAIELSIPNTAKNYYYLKTLFDPNTEKSNNFYFDVRVTVGSETFNHDRLFAVEKNNATISIRIEILNEWKQMLKDTKLSEIDLPLINFTKDDVEFRWANAKQYFDGDAGYWYPLVNYGSWRLPHRRVVVEDLRPFLHALFLLQKMFAHIGWCFRSPFYETSFGRSLDCYLLKSEYGNDEARRRLRHVDVIKKYEWFPGTEVIHAAITDWTQELIDEGDNFDPVQGIYVNPFEGSLIIIVTTSDSFGSDFVTQDDSTLEFSLSVNKQEFLAGNNHTTIHTEKISMPKQSTYRFEVEIDLLADEFCFLSIGETNQRTTWDIDFSIELQTKIVRTFHTKGDVIDMKKEVIEDLTCWDVFEGLQHIMYGIIDEDFVAKTVNLLTPFDATIFGEDITGYFNGTLVDLMSKQPSNTTRSIMGEVSRLRYSLLAFAESTDELGKNKKRPDGTDYFSKTVDHGAFYKNGINDGDRNPLFEHTLLEWSSLYGFYLVLAEPIPFLPYLPFMTDNDERKISYDIKPRILYNAGFGTIPNPGLSHYRFEDTFIDEVAFAFNGSGQLSNDVLKLNGAAIEERLVYGEEEGDLWSMVYGKFFLQIRGLIKMDLIAQLTHAQYFALDIKNLFQIEYDGHPITGRILQINDFDPCTATPPQILLLPELTTDGYCIESTPTAECNNVVFIIATPNDTCVTFSLGVSTIDCNIISITWQIKQTGLDWYDIGLGNTVEVCDQCATYTVRAIVLTDCESCPAVTATKTINPCAFNTNCLLTITTNELGQRCIEVDWTPQGTLPPYTVVVEWSLDQTTWTELDPSYILCDTEPNTIYYFRLTFDIIGSCCDSIVKLCSINTSSQQCNNQPVLICVPIDDGMGNICYEYAIGGVLSEAFEYFVVTAVCSSDGMIYTWMQGDDPICCTGILTATAMVHFCNCPPVCTDEIMCDPGGCTIFTPGTALLFEVCN